MPNHCYQTVTLKSHNGLSSGQPDIIRCLNRELSDRKRERFCDVVSPMPLRTYLLPEVDESEKYGFKATTPAWYNWRLKNWGTKWDVCEVIMIEDNLRFEDEAKTWFTFQCWTAWGPPIPIWKKLHNMGIEVRAYYEDEGMNFKGEFIDGVDKAWRPHIDEVIEEDEACRYK